MLILNLFDKCFRDVYYVFGLNPKTKPLSRGWKLQEKYHISYLIFKIVFYDQLIYISTQLNKIFCKNTSVQASNR